MDKLDIARTETMKLKSARGKDYYRILDNIAANVKGDFIADVQVICDTRKDGRVTLFHIGCLMIRYELNCAATISLLEKFCGAPSGTYERLKERGLKVSEMLEAVMRDPLRFELPFELVSRYIRWTGRLESVSGAACTAAAAG